MVVFYQKFLSELIKHLHHLKINGNYILKVIKDLNPNKAHGWDENFYQNDKTLW